MRAVNSSKFINIAELMLRFSMAGKTKLLVNILPFKSLIHFVLINTHNVYLFPTHKGKNLKTAVLHLLQKPKRTT